MDSPVCAPADLAAAEAELTIRLLQRSEVVQSSSQGIHSLRAEWRGQGGGGGGSGVEEDEEDDGMWDDDLWEDAQAGEGSPGAGTGAETRFLWTSDSADALPAGRDAVPLSPRDRGLLNSREPEGEGEGGGQRSQAAGPFHSPAPAGACACATADAGSEGSGNGTGCADADILVVAKASTHPLPGLCRPQSPVPYCVCSLPVCRLPLCPFSPLFLATPSLNQLLLPTFFRLLLRAP